MRLVRLVWYVQGDEDNTLLASKIDAETWARELFPDEDVDKRYARIYSRNVYTFEKENGQ